MKNLLRSLSFTLLLSFGGSAIAESSVMISPTAGGASISNIDGYSHSFYRRLDVSFYPFSLLGFNLFTTNYGDFKLNDGSTPAAVSLGGYGGGVTLRLPLGKHIQPFVRKESFVWDSTASSLGKTLATDNGVSSGLALGVNFLFDDFFGLKLESVKYTEVSGADIEQLSLGMIFEF